MKMHAKKVDVIEVEGEGLIGLLGQRVLIMCTNYFYEGILAGVNDTCCMLSDAGIVYSTGDWDKPGWGDRQAVLGDHYVMLQAIESFCACGGKGS